VLVAVEKRGLCVALHNPRFQETADILEPLVVRVADAPHHFNRFNLGSVHELISLRRMASGASPISAATTSERSSRWPLLRPQAERPRTRSQRATRSSRSTRRSASTVTGAASGAMAVRKAALMRVW
jgi:hypothetical protein